MAAHVQSGPGPEHDQEHTHTPADQYAGSGPGIRGPLHVCRIGYSSQGIVALALGDLASSICGRHFWVRFCCNTRIRSY